MDKNTFGKSPAALVLVDILEDEGNSKIIRKISSKLNFMTTRLNEIVHCNLSGKSKRWAIQLAWNDFQEVMENILHDKIRNYALNVGKMYFQEAMISQNAIEKHWKLIADILNV